MKMYKVRIDYTGHHEDQSFVTELPKIPNIGDRVAFCHSESWVYATVQSITYELDEDNSYYLAELSITDYFETE